jgi:hypothetical protein
MIPRASGLVFIALVLTALSACDGTSSAQQATDSGAETGSTPCTHDGCMVTLAEIASACPATFDGATTSACTYATVSKGPCGALTHVAIQTINPLEDCYYDMASGALVGGISRSDAGFTKIAGTIPTAACPATTGVCGPAGP